jgi:hypothetical protein
MWVVVDVARLRIVQTRLVVSPAASGHTLKLGER